MDLNCNCPAHPSNPGGLTNPANWTAEARLTDTSFDIEKAPTRFNGQLFLGMYQGMAAAGNDFLPVWAMPHAKRDGSADPASIFFRRTTTDSLPEAAPTGHNQAAATRTPRRVAGESTR